MNQKVKMDQTTSSIPTDAICIVCLQSQTVFSIGHCDHPFCYRCSTNLRVLCNKNKCPVCRCRMFKVLNVIYYKYLLSKVSLYSIIYL